MPTYGYRIVRLKNTFFPLQVKNKSRYRDSEHAFILGSMDSKVANSNC
jgi:hypothetical protein